MKLGPGIVSQPKIGQPVPNIMGEQRCGLDLSVHCLCCGLYEMLYLLPYQESNFSNV